MNSLSIYLRPFLESVTGLDVNVLSLVLLGLGLGGMAGLSIAGFVLRRNPTAALIGLPSALALLALLLIAVGPVLWATAALLVLWGLFNTPIPAAWGTWMAQVIPDDLEAGGGLQVALIQFAIAGGASAGGMLFDTAGWWSAFLLAAALLAGSALLAAAASPRA
jgi:predicted MFS family arabinose efflux permease